MNNIPSVHWEFSLSSEQTYEQTVHVIKALSMTCFNVSHKHPGLKELNFTKKLRADFPDSTIIPHISLRKLHLGKSMPIGKKIALWLSTAAEIKPDHILVVSGYPRMKYDTLWALKEMESLHNTIPLAVAYNPYISDHDEESRLHQKLAFPSVKAVYLQIGENPYYIEHGLKIINSIRSDIKVFGCLILPNPFIRSNLRKSTWHGVQFSEEFFNHPIHAWEVTNQTRQIFERLNITPVVEVLPFREETCVDYFNM